MTRCKKSDMNVHDFPIEQTEFPAGQVTSEDLPCCNIFLGCLPIFAGLIPRGCLFESHFPCLKMSTSIFWWINVSCLLFQMIFLA